MYIHKYWLCVIPLWCVCSRARLSILTLFPFKTPWHFILTEFIFMNTLLEFIDLPSFSFLSYWHASQIWLSLSVFGSNFPIFRQAELLSLALRHFEGLTVWRTGKQKHEKPLKSRCNKNDDSNSWCRYSPFRMWKIQNKRKNNKKKKKTTTIFIL